MADVRLLLIPTVVGVLALVRAVPADPDRLTALFIGLGGLGVLLFGRRMWWVLVAACGLAMLQTRQNHLLFGFWSIAAWGLFPTIAQRRWVMRVQLSILYGFTGLAKLTTRWLSGEGLAGALEIEGTRDLVPDALLAPMAVGAAVTELTLAVALWVPRARRPVLLLGAGLHASLAVMGRVDPYLVFFNGLAMLWLWDSTRGDDIDDAGRPVTVAPVRPVQAGGAAIDTA